MKADVTIKTKSGKNILHAAIKNRDKTIIKGILKIFPVQIFKQMTIGGFTPLRLAQNLPLPQSILKKLLIVPKKKNTSNRLEILPKKGLDPSIISKIVKRFGILEEEEYLSKAREFSENTASLELLKLQRKLQPKPILKYQFKFKNLPKPHYSRRRSLIFLNEKNYFESFAEKDPFLLEEIMDPLSRAKKTSFQIVTHKASLSLGTIGSNVAISFPKGNVSLKLESHINTAIFPGEKKIETQNSLRKEVKLFKPNLPFSM